jgi:hypothetical protein
MIIVFALSGTSVLNAGILNIKMGLFNPNMDSDLWDMNMYNLAFEKQDMRDKYYGIEYEHNLNRFVSFSIEGGWYEKDHYSFYRDLVYADDGSEIPQNIGLKIYSFEAGFKFYPMGRRTALAPFLGVGGGLYYWKYEQWGDFYDAIDDVVYQDEYAESSTYSPGFNVKGGFIVRLSRDIGVLLEAKYHYLKGNLSSFFEEFEDLDLSGMTYCVGVSIRF